MVLLLPLLVVLTAEPCAAREYLSPPRSELQGCGSRGRGARCPKTPGETPKRPGRESVSVRPRPRRSVGGAERFCGSRAGIRCHPAWEGAAAVLGRTPRSSLASRLSVAPLLSGACPFFSLFLRFTCSRLSRRCGLRLFQGHATMERTPAPAPFRYISGFVSFSLATSPVCKGRSRKRKTVVHDLRTKQRGSSSGFRGPRHWGSSASHGPEAPGFSALSSWSSSEGPALRGRLGGSVWNSASSHRHRRW